MGKMETIFVRVNKSDGDGKHHEHAASALVFIINATMSLMDSTLSDAVKTAPQHQTRTRTSPEPLRR
jgi:hypothetical protein